ncbi:hypothetical protein Tco_0791847 [Tanacetum coccineum]
MVRALLLDKKNQSQALATVKAVEESCVTCGGAHSYRNCPATDGNVYRDNIQEYVSQATAVNYNQGNTGYRHPIVANQIRPPGFHPVQNNQNNQRNNHKPLQIKTGEIITTKCNPNFNFGTTPSSLLPTSFTPFKGGDFILEEIEACLTSESIPPGIDDTDFDLKEDLLTLERLLNSDLTSTLPPEEQNFNELKTVEPSSDEPPELEIKDLPPHLESHKRAIAWKMSDIKGIDPKFCTHKFEER